VIVANGLKFDATGVLHVADTSRGAVWKEVMGADGKGGKPALLAQSPLLAGADDLAFNGNGDVWVAANELNALVTISPSGVVKTIAKNSSKGPLEFRAALVVALLKISACIAAAAGIPWAAV
jgi:sugar lactone lactonase YvrE